MFFNSYKFYDYTQLENCSLCQNNISFYKPNFVINFNFKVKEKKKILQTADLINQFFAARPKITSSRKFGRISNLNISIRPNFYSLFRSFRVIHSVRSSSRKKLVTFHIKRNGFIYVVLRDFVTLFPFKIKSYDFHDWRFKFVFASCYSNKNFSEYETYRSINFYFNYFFPF